MTIHIPLGTITSDTGPSISRPKYVIDTRNSQDDIRDVLSCLRSSKKIIVLTGAGISTAANIPDFRSSSGLFNGRNDKKGKSKEYNAKDLFHVKCLSSHKSLASHHILINTLASLSESASPTPFHQYIESLSRNDQLLRCYTQNIDALELKAGLQMGISSTSKSKSNSRISKLQNRNVNTMSLDHLINPLLEKSVLKTTVEEQIVIQAVPLHGLITDLRCTFCHTKIPMSDHLPLPPYAIPCPTCKLHSDIRDALYERRRPSGLLRADVVLYGEEHPQGELIGQMIEKDLKSVDCLLVVGTTLSIPGIKRIVKEISKKLHYSSNRGKSKKNKNKVILINNEYPKGNWEGVFDYWISGDIQDITNNYLTNTVYLEELIIKNNENEKKLPITPKKERMRSIFPPTPESIDRITYKLDHKIEEQIDKQYETPMQNKRKRNRKEEKFECLIPSPISLKRKYKKKEVMVEINRDRENTPTPLSKPV
ncbi:uncharacterized protein I206_105643 [Kwoniella pini CBS 10737]|uniref:Deacetylase sirtuin-type domain-containing protein n=1 Tax=Kwoniella pini CBS 10737 TaxID=1296096 RepID=A0A1B9I3Q6_9TREE|nr:uncharacterized protein I206_03457 [Kwoniella pini CBS 10737]OCF50138.1 hypothetical protein I206_03457 [Kwoniella pini CBS 10737]